MSYCFSPHYLYIIKRMKEPKQCLSHVLHCDKHSGLKEHSKNVKTTRPPTLMFDISLVISNTRRVLSQRLLYLLKSDAG